MSTMPVARIGVVPAYNEERTVAAVLEQLYPQVDCLVVVDDGSTDATAAQIALWIGDRERVEFLRLPRNRGTSAAYLAAFDRLRRRLAAGELGPDDLVVTVDADGQHDVAVLPTLERRFTDGALDVVIARRDLSYHGPVKRLGNEVLSRWASLWAGRRLHDVVCGYRIVRLGALVHALEYYRGYRYSETAEAAVVLTRLGYRVSSDVLVPVPVSRSRTRLRDGVLDVLVIPRAALRVRRGRRVGADDGERSGR